MHRLHLIAPNKPGLSSCHSVVRLREVVRYEQAPIVGFRALGLLVEHGLNKQVGARCGQAHSGPHEALRQAGGCQGLNRRTRKAERPARAHSTRY